MGIDVGLQQFRADMKILYFMHVGPIYEKKTRLYSTTIIYFLFSLEVMGGGGN